MRRGILKRGKPIREKPKPATGPAPTLSPDRPGDKSGEIVNWLEGYDQGFLWGLEFGRAEGQEEMQLRAAQAAGKVSLGARTEVLALVPEARDGGRRESQITIEGWRAATFGAYPSTAKMAARANLEMAELIDAISDGAPAEKVAEEAADVVIVLYGVAGSLGLDLATAIDRKMAVNRARKWKVVEGIGHHVREKPHG